MPSAMALRSVGTMRPTADSTTEKLAAPIATPVKNPAEKMTEAAPVAFDIRKSART